MTRAVAIANVATAFALLCLLALAVALVASPEFSHRVGVGLRSVLP